MGEVIQTLWDSGALGAIFTGLVTILGQLSALNTQKYTAVLEALQKQQAADITAHDAAFTRTKDDGGTWTRRAMMFAAFAMLGIAPFVFAFFKPCRINRNWNNLIILCVSQLLPVFIHEFCEVISEVGLIMIFQPAYKFLQIL